MDPVNEGALRETAVGAAHHPVTADHVRQPHQALGDELWVFDHVGVVRHDAGDEDLVLRQRHVFPDLPLVLVPRVGLLH